MSGAKKELEVVEVWTINDWNIYGKPLVDLVPQLEKLNQDRKIWKNEIIAMGKALFDYRAHEKEVDKRRFLQEQATVLAKDIKEHAPDMRQHILDNLTADSV